MKDYRDNALTGVEMRLKSSQKFPIHTEVVFNQI